MLANSKDKGRQLFDRRFVNRELVPALTGAIFVYFASSDLMWALVAFWGCGTFLSRIEDILDKLDD